MSISRIEITLQLPVELTDEEMQRLGGFVDKICRRAQPKGWVYWPSGYGARPNFSQVDSMLLGLPVDPGAPTSGEPTFDDSVYCITTCAREAYPEEIERDRKRDEARWKRQRTLKYRAFGAAHRALGWVADVLVWMEKGRWIR